nr:MAG: protein of unknown function DUF2190 [Bacteriophage sp.]
MANKFQGQVNILPAIGVPGQHMSTNPLVSTQKGYCAADTVTIGGFVWAVTEKDALVKSTGTGVPLGFAVREITNPLGYNESASNTVPKGFPVSVAVKGDFAVVTGTAATVGQSVFAVLADGSIKTGTADEAVEDAVQTDYKVVNINGGGAVGDIIVISNWA